MLNNPGTITMNSSIAMRPIVIALAATLFAATCLSGAAQPGPARQTGARKVAELNSKQRMGLLRYVEDTALDDDTRIMYGEGLISTHPGTEEAARAKALIAPLVAAAAEKASLGQWSYWTAKDPESGRDFTHAQLFSENEIEPKSADILFATLTVRRSKGIDEIFLGVPKLETLCGGGSGCPVVVRFDEEAKITLQGDPAKLDGNAIVRLPYAETFPRLLQAKRLSVQINKHQAREQSLEFKLKGLEEARLKE